MTPEQAEALLAPFPAEAIGKLPRITCPPCSKSPSKVCNEHRKHKCAECGNYITERHIHLDYVGHAVTTKRLLDVDPEWTWEPVALGQYGQPVATDGGLWIKLTIAGVSRYGWGDGPDMKQMISDAIRNAAMRFGVALDLWSKEDLRADESAETGQQTVAAPPASKNRVQQLQSRLSAMIADGVKGVADERTKRGLPKLAEDCTDIQLDAWADLLNEMDTNLSRPLEPIMSRAESQAREPMGDIADRPCDECGGTASKHAETCSAPF